MGTVFTKDKEHCFSYVQMEIYSNRRNWTADIKSSKSIKWKLPLQDPWKTLMSFHKAEGD